MSASWEPCSATGCPCPNHRLPSYSIGEPDNFNGDPTFHHLTQTNDVPLCAEKLTTLSMITNLQSSVASVDASKEKLKALREAYTTQLETIDCKLQTLKDEKARLSDAIQTRQGVLSSIRRVPQEILQRIFMDTIQFPVSYELRGAEKTRNWYTFGDGESPLWIIERVSKRWTAALLSNPALWSFIDIYASNTNFNGRHTRYISRLVRQMARAQSSPLSIAIRRSTSETYTNKLELPIPLPMLLLPNAHRIQEFFLYLPITYIMGLSPLRNHLEMLTRLFIINTLFYGLRSDIALPLRIFDRCPRLKEIDTLDIVSTACVFTLPWSQITEYHSSHPCISSEATRSRS